MITLENIGFMKYKKTTIENNMPRRVSDGLALGEMFLGSRMRRDKLRLSSYCGVVFQINATPHTKAGLPQLAGQVVRHGYEA